MRSRFLRGRGSLALAVLGLSALAMTRRRPRDDDRIAALEQALDDAAWREAAARDEQHASLSRLRHDVRGALSPALLIADRLMMSGDADKTRAGELIVKSITRATELLATTKQPPTPAARPD